MPMKLKAQLMDDVTVKRALARLSYEIIEKSRDLENVVLIGIKTRGVPIAEQIAANIETHTGVKVQTCTLDITFYRDDLTKRHDLPTVNTQTLPVDRRCVRSATIRRAILRSTRKIIKQTL